MANGFEIKENLRNTATRVDVTNNTLTLDNFRELTVGRKHNLGTLKLVKDKQGNITGLRCSKHHFMATYINPSQKLSDAQELRDELGKVIEHELKSIFDLNKDEFKDLPQSSRNDLTQKQEKLLSQFKNVFMDIEHHNNYLNKKIVDGVQRSTIKTIVELLDGLKKLSADTLLNYDVKTIAKFMVRGGNVTNEDTNKHKAIMTAYNDVCATVSLANVDELKMAGNTFIRNCFHLVNHYFTLVNEIGELPDAEQQANSERLKFNEILHTYGIQTLYLDDSGTLSVKDGADKNKVQQDFKTLIGATCLRYSEESRSLNYALGCELSNKDIVKELKSFIDRINTAKIESDIDAVSKKIGEILSGVTDREALQKATDNLLRKCYKVFAGIDNNALVRQSCDRLFRTAFDKSGITTLTLDKDRNCQLVLDESAEINEIKKDLAKLLAATAGHDVIINGFVPDKDAMRSNFGGASAIVADKRVVLAALREFSNEFDHGRDPAPAANQQFVPHPGFEEDPAPDPAGEDLFEDAPAPDPAPEINLQPIYEVELPEEHQAAPPADQQ